MYSAWDRSGSQTLRRSFGSVLDPRFRIGNSSAWKVRTSRSGRWSRSDRQGTAWQWRGSDQEIWHAHRKHSVPCVYALSVRHARKLCQKNVCDTECVYTSRRTHSSCHYVGDFVVPLPSWFFPPARCPPICFPPIIISECLSVSADVWWSHCVEFKLEIWFASKYHFQLWESHMSQSSFSGSRSSRYLFPLEMICRFRLASLFMFTIARVVW